MPAKRKAARKAMKKKAARKAVKGKVARKAVKKQPRKAARRPAAPKAPPAPPSGIGAVSHHLDYTTYDLDGVKRFYTDLLGFREYNLDASMNYLMVRTGTSSSLGFMPPMPGMESTPPREAGLYFMVKDVDRAYADLVAKGVTFDQAPADMPWGHRVAVTRDPENRKVYLATVKAG